MKQKMKKSIFTTLMLVLAAFSSVAQKTTTNYLECSELIGTDTTSEVYNFNFSKEPILIYKDGGKIGLEADFSSEPENLWVDLFLVVHDSIGFEHGYNNIDVMFRGGNIIMFEAVDKWIDSLGYVNIVLQVGDIYEENIEFEMFKTQEVDFIRIHTTDTNYTDWRLTREQSERFTKTIDCLYKISTY
jgi:ABC-type oligopeptide transport system substrate-binding subunit